MFIEGHVAEGICSCWNPNNYTDILTGKQIYKDECSRCFATPKDESGLDVCLKCLEGSCNPIGGDS
jgi:ubiquitin carboxyl-terminal hydrolase 5/13